MGGVRTDWQEGSSFPQPHEHLRPEAPSQAEGTARAEGRCGMNVACSRIRNVERLVRQKPESNGQLARASEDVHPGL